MCWIAIATAPFAVVFALVSQLGLPSWVFPAYGIFFFICFVKLLEWLLSKHAVLGSGAKIELIDEHDTRGQSLLDSSAQLFDWAEDNEFDWLGAYWLIFPPVLKVFVASWQESEGLIRVSRVIEPSSDSIQVTSALSGEAWSRLNTTNSSRSYYGPRAFGNFGQTFEGVEVDELLRLHKEGLGFIRNRFGMRAVPAEGNPVQHEFDCARAEQAHRYKLWFWTERSVIWSVRKRRYMNETVAEQYSNYDSMRGSSIFREDRYRR